MTKDQKKQKRRMQAVINNLASIKHQCADAGMWETFHIADKAQEKSGWEMVRWMEENK